MFEANCIRLKFSFEFKNPVLLGFQWDTAGIGGNRHLLVCHLQIIPSLLVAAPVSGSRWFAADFGVGFIRTFVQGLRADGCTSH